MPAALRPGHVPDRDAGEDQRRAVGRGEARRSLEERAHDLAADGARAEHADAQRLEAHGRRAGDGAAHDGMVPTVAARRDRLGR